MIAFRSPLLSLPSRVQCLVFRTVMSFRSTMSIQANAGRKLEQSDEGLLKSGLYLVATPIGNLEDITLRALRVLKSADVILSEDTRHSGKLLKHYNIETPLALDAQARRWDVLIKSRRSSIYVNEQNKKEDMDFQLSYHKFNESKREEAVLKRLQQGEVIALISDAGTPGISDPGMTLARLCVKEKIPVVPIPGPCALVAALCASGLPTDEFKFVGFLPRYARSRRQILLTAASETATQIFFVPPHKFHQFLEETLLIFSESRQCVMAREMTKLHEEFWHGSLADAKEAFSTCAPRGEITLLIEGKLKSDAELPPESELEHKLNELISSGHSLSLLLRGECLEPLSWKNAHIKFEANCIQAVKMVSEATQVKRKAVYSLALSIFEKRSEGES